MAVNSSGGALIGVDMAETYIRVELFDLGLNVLARAVEDMRPGESRPEQAVGHVATAVGSVVAQAGVEGARVLGVGVSVPGQVDRDTGIAEYAPNWDWHDVPLLDLLSEHIAYPLYRDGGRDTISAVVSVDPRTGAVVEEVAPETTSAGVPPSLRAGRPA
ncbi:ROK family protein [Streptomyces sp. NPDC005921]